MKTKYKFAIAGGVVGYLVAIIFYGFIFLTFDNTNVGIYETSTKSYSIFDLTTNHLFLAVKKSTDFRDLEFPILTFIIVLVGGGGGLLIHWLLIKLRSEKS